MSKGEPTMNFCLVNPSRMNWHRRLQAALPALGLLLLTAPSLRAQVTSVPIFERSSTQQTGPTTVTSTGFDLSARIFETTLGDVGTATLTYPGTGMTIQTGTYSAATGTPPVLNYDPAVFATQAALNAMFPFGTYTTQYSGGTAGPGTVTTSFTQTAFAGSTPTFTVPTFNEFQNLNAAQDFTAAFNTDVTGNVATENDIFFDIYNANTGALVLDDGFQPSNLTSFFVPANTLMSGTAYFAQLNFSNRINATDANNIGHDLGFDRVTTLNFTTAPAVPEASTTVSLGLLLALGVGGMVIAAKRKKTI